MMKENVIQINGGITTNVDVNVENAMHVAISYLDFSYMYL